MSWQFTKASHIGGRKEQQDRVNILKDNKNKQYCCVLADGMGGHQGGAMAAQQLMDISQQLWPPNIPAKQWLEKVCQQTHQAIQQEGKENNINPRTTAVLLLIQKNKIYWTHIGDSRLYHIRGKQIIEQSYDHSVVQMLVALGKIKPEEMATHPDQNRLTKSLGGDEVLSIDIQTQKVKHQDVFILASDGLWETITPEELINANQQSIDSLIATAAERGGKTGDNISICFACYQSESVWERLLFFEGNR